MTAQPSYEELKIQIQELQEKDIYHHTLLESVNDAILVHEIGFDGMPGKFIDANRVALKRLGYSHAELLKLTPKDITTENGYKDLSKARANIISNSAAIFETIHYARNGRPIPVESHVSVLELGGRRVAVSVARDLNERKRAENQLKETERFLSSTLDGLSVHIAVLDERGEIILTNKTYRDFGERNGVEPGAVSEGTNYLAVCDTASGEHSREAAPFAEGIREVLSGKLPSFELEYPCHSPEEKRWFVGRVTPIQDEGSRRVVIAHEDITERKRAEEGLRESEERFMNVLYASDDAILLIGDNTFIDCNEATASMLGYDSREQFLQTHPSELSPETQPDGRNSREKADEMMRMAFDRGFHRFEWIHLRADGEHFPVEVSLTPIIHNGRNLLYCIWRDITQEKWAEEALRKSEEKHRALVEGLPDTVMRFDREGRHLFVSDNVRETVDIEPGRFIGKTHAELGFPENHCRFWKESIQRVFDSDAPFETEFTFEGKAGPVIFDWRLIPERDAQDTVSSVLSISRDITAHRKAEKEYQTLFREMLEGFALHEIILDADGTPVDYRFLATNPAFERMTGLKASDILGRTALEVLSGPERHWIETYGKVALIGEPVNFESYSAELGKHFYVTAFRPVEGQFACMFQDITERKRAAEVLCQRLEYEQLLNEVSTIALVADGLSELQDRCLALAGKRLGVDRAYFFRHDETTDTMDNTHEWCAEGTTPQQDKLQCLPESTFSWWVQTMRRNEIICYPDIEEIPDEPTKDILRTQDIKSILVIPLFISGQYYGFLGLDDCARHREWRQEDVEIILSISRIVAMATEHMQAKKRLQDERQQLLSIFNGIEEAIYIADPETYEVLFVNDFLKKLLDKDLLRKKCYEHFQGLNAPCEFCTNPIILQNSGEVYRWEYYNPNLNRHYLLFDRMIKWTDGRDVRFEMTIDITKRKQVEEALKNSEASLKEAQQLAEIGNWSLDLRTGELSMSDQMYSIIGLERTPEALDVATHEKHYTPESWQRFRSAAETARETGKSYEIEMEVVRDSGGNRHVVVHGEVSKVENGQTVALHGTIQDITERVALHAQLAQAQKMESVGRLAGGVAHDFNNMLSVIIGNAELAMEGMAPDDPRHNNLGEIFSAANRSADITRQLLAFARKQTIAPKVLDLNRTIKSMLKMLRRLIGEDIDLAWLPETTIWPVRMDPSQIDQILANLCVNARDAIVDVGKITIETGTVTFDSAYCAEHPGFAAGDFVLLAVSDNGRGMEQETLANLFEPFFTTKDVDKGTGLGLATVYGIVKQNDGFINVYSEPDQGTTFRIYLPRYLAETESPEKKASDKLNLDGTETILLVEDESPILKVTTMMLELTGYKVLAAGTPGEAIALAREHAGEIHLLMTDVVMPEMNGRDLARNLLSLYPNLKRLFMSGYTANVIAHHGVLDEGVQFIQKPFAKQDLAIKVREVLDADNL